MKCPECYSDQILHQEGWEEYWDGENEECYWWGRWVCLCCNHVVHSYDEGYEHPDE